MYIWRAGPSGVLVEMASHLVWWLAVIVVLRESLVLEGEKRQAKLHPPFSCKKCMLESLAIGEQTQESRQ